MSFEIGDAVQLITDEAVLAAAGWSAETETYSLHVAPHVGQTGIVNHLKGDRVYVSFGEGKKLSYPATVVRKVAMSTKEVLVRAETDCFAPLLDSQRKEEQDLCDLQLHADGDASKPCILVHRSIMYLKAPKLREIVEEHGVVEEGRGEKKNSQLGKIKLMYSHMGSHDHTAIGMLVKYCYGHQVAISVDVCEELYKVATRLGLQRLMETCYQLLKDHVSSDDLVKVYMIATRIPSRQLQDEVMNYIRANPSKVLVNPDIEELDLAAFKTLFDEKNLEKLAPEDEILFYKAILRWINAEVCNTKVMERKEERMPHLGSLLEQVRFFFIDALFLRKEMEKDIIKAEKGIVSKIYEEGFMMKLASSTSDEQKKHMQRRDAQPAQWENVKNDDNAAPADTAGGDDAQSTDEDRSQG